MGKLRSPWKMRTSYLIAAFLVLMFWMFHQEAEAETRVELSAGATYVGGNRYDSEALILTDRFDNGKYEVGVLLQLRLDCANGADCRRGEAERPNQALIIKRVVHRGNFEMSFGMSYWHNESPAWDSHTPFVLGMGYRFFDDFFINYTHFSTGGSSANNGGLDFISLGYSF